MGSYLSEPVTDKVSGDEENDKLGCGHSSMQGWRVSQEDAHNCLLSFDKNTALFAVYDGHGGHEVAQYTAQKLPDFIKETEAYKNEDMEKALVDTFLGFDATIAREDVISILKQIAGTKEAMEEETDEEENVNFLYEEAAMPLEQVIEKYKSSVLNPAVKTLKDGEGHPNSPFLKARKDGDAKAGGSGHKSAFAVCSSSSSSRGSCADSSNDGVSSSSNVATKTEANGSDKIKPDEASEPVGSSSKPEVTKSEVTKSEVTKSEVSKSEVSKSEVSESKNGEEKPIPEIKVDAPDSSGDNAVESTPVSTEPLKKVEHQNGDVDSPDQPKNEDVTSTSPLENGEVPKKGKGKALMKTKGVKVSAKPTRNLRPARNQLYSKLLDFEDGSEEESEDEEDKTFEGPQDLDSDDSDAEKAGEADSSDGDDDDNVNVALELDDEEDVEEEEEDDLEEQEECDEFARNMREDPGSDSGCTAVVALLRGNELYVANAGDSRCIVCRNGTAVEMSFDHKPEDKPERERVVKAGGKVTSDGRVNGGLNLSRAIGDHAYKQNKDLSDREQMITALPDVRKITINPAEDEFMVLACDGIWNFMSSQEVVEFVRPRLQEKNVKLSQICEEMFDHCLAPNTLGDGTGCDNMTAIIVQFKTNILKRPASSESIEEDNSKRAKTEDNVQVESTA